MQVERIGDATLYLADCRDVLPSVSGAQAVATDPPYGIAYETNWRKRLDTPEMLAGDDTPPLDAVAMMAECLIDAGALYLATRFDVAPEWMDAIRDAGLKIKTPILWDKRNHTSGDLRGDYGARVEMFLFAHKGRHILRCGRQSNLWSYSRPRAGLHPTPKPVELMERMVRNSTDTGGLVVDPFMGSGTTGVACITTGRRFIGIELDAVYFEHSCQRIREAHNRPSLFGAA